MIAHIKTAAVADYLLHLAFESNKLYTMTPSKLMNLIYIAQGAYLATMKTYLIEEDFEAWEQEPMLTSLLKDLAPYEGKVVDKFYKKNELSKLILLEKKVIEYIWDIYKEYTESSLREITTMNDSPWHKVRDLFPHYINPLIPKKMLMKYCKAIPLK